MLLYTKSDNLTRACDNENLFICYLKLDLNLNTKKLTKTNIIFAIVIMDFIIVALRIIKSLNRRKKYLTCSIASW